MTYKHYSFIVSGLLGLFFLSGCKTLEFGNNPMLDSEISPLQTFAVLPVKGNYNAIMSSSPERVRQTTTDSIIEKMTAKGYTLVGEGQTPDFTVNPQWMISTQNNRAQLLNAGSVETSRQIPELSRVASISIAVNEGDTNELMWRNTSPWPFDVRYATIADIQNSVAWALESFPVQINTMPKVEE
ncbi:hypothetical protein [Rubellicoccus peritrichatus]|uniref:DUF4136 domain-containing protein n=1 Tax=Rubellicoccus peritrichatus TaxID=3080537 RepID=A0AAQ3L6K8_9BACT|nr:hypothetical protein [Puniceicoccus sp. CR14]WOO40016.1 hypothetical protein RZN69_15440 [Puniceicoccus sp. CR14]